MDKNTLKESALPPTLLTTSMLKCDSVVRTLTRLQIGLEAMERNKREKEIDVKVFSHTGQLQCKPV